MITSRRVIFIGIENTYGVDPVLTAADSLKVENPAFSYLDPRTFEPVSTKPSFGAEVALFGGTLGQLTFDVVIKGSGTAGTAPPAAAALQACGLSEVLAPGVSVTYAPVSTGQKSAAIYYHKDGKLYKLLGSLGTVNFVNEVGMPCKASFTFSGHVEGPTDLALPAPTFSTVVAPVYLNSAFTAHGYGAAITNLSIDLGNEIAKPGDVSKADGFGVIRITGRAVVGSFDPEETLVATFDPEGQWQANAAAEIASGTLGPTAGNQLAFTMPKAQFREIGEGDRDKISIFEIGYTATETSGDDELSLVFT